MALFFFYCVMTPSSFRVISNYLLEYISLLSPFRKHQEVASFVIPLHSLQVWEVFPSRPSSHHWVSRAFSRIVSHWDSTKWFVYLSIWGKSEKGQVKSEEPTVVTPAEQWLGEVPEAIEEIPLLNIDEKNSLHHLWAQGMDSDYIKVDTDAHQMMTPTWFLGTLAMLLTVALCWTSAIPVHVAHLGLALLTHITNLSTLITFISLLLLFFLIPGKIFIFGCWERGCKSGWGHCRAKAWSP